MRIHDITLPIGPSLPVFPGDPASSVERLASVVASDPRSCNLSMLHLPTHCGTHVDPPSHLGGRQTVDQIALDLMCGPARVVDLRRGPRAVDARTLGACDFRGVRRVLLKTHDGPTNEEPFRDDHAFLTEDAAQWLRDVAQVVLVGTDCLSVDTLEDSALPAHRVLLLADPPVVVVEGLALRDVAAGDYDLYCLPLRLQGGDGAPARAVLVER